MLEKVLESMHQVSRSSQDVLIENSANLLQRKLAIKADAAEGHLCSARRFYRPGKEGEHGVVPAQVVLLVSVPYFSTIHITREGTISREGRGH
jgi:hypothetical protein